MRISDWSSDVCSSDLAQQDQPLPRGAGERLVARAAHGEIFFLRAAPIGNEEIDERCARADHVVGRAVIGTLDTAARTRLDDGDVTLVVTARAGDGQAPAQGSDRKPGGQGKRVS